MSIKKCCKRCGHEMDARTIGWYCENCGCFEEIDDVVRRDSKNPFIVKTTIADKMRETICNIDNEELAYYLCEIIDCDVCKTFIIKNEYCNCKDGFPYGILAWLEQSVKE